MSNDFFVPPPAQSRFTNLYIRERAPLSRLARALYLLPQLTRIVLYIQPIMAWLLNYSLHTRIKTASTPQLIRMQISLWFEFIIGLQVS